ncbi:Stk1 family PASTA domain-containing Ser/Thr kinase [Carbonactinospora thermoautotrophica]|uniref:Stk1 family PASTA domain-containing Ser/Thr kinase n=1 Tax=Carbonactinospora thermoautotrophica TaxID=1469144 RepID=UPI003DAA288D
MDTTISDPLLGQVLGGRYRVERPVARGGMAAVYQALDTRLDRRVAVKVMNPDLAQDEQFVARFIREAKSAAALTHPNVVSVYDQGADNGHLYLVMELLSGRTLRDLLHERGRLTPRQTLSILEPVLAALAAAHTAGLIHRDVKPENVLLSDDGRVKVVDFGLARSVSAATNTSTDQLMGTVSYLAPEQVERGFADQRSDVYAAGIVLYEMLTGEKPHHGENPIEVIYQHVHEDVPPPSSRVPGLAPEFDRLVSLATARDAAARLPDAGAFLAEVRRLRTTLPPEALDLGDTPGTSPLSEPTTVLPRPPADGPRPAKTAVVPTYPPEPPPALRRPRGPLAFLAVLTAALLVALVAFLVGSAQFTRTPDLRNRTLAEAQEEARRFGLTVVAPADKQEWSETVARGRVVTTDPEPGHRIRKGGTITPILSKGPERYHVPPLKGLTEEEATRALAESNLAKGQVIREYDADVPEGEVIRSDPPAGTALKRGTSVNLVISKGAEPVDVPQVINMPLDQAMAKLREAGLKGEVVKRVDVPFVPDNTVVNQDPKFGRLPKGSTVKLTVTKGPELVRVPRVTGMTMAKAKKVLEKLGFQVFELKLPFGGDTVANQDPEPGTQRPRGSWVTIRNM